MIAFDVGPIRPRPAGVGTYVQSLARGLDAIGYRDLVYIGRRADGGDLPSGIPAIERSSRLPYPVWVQLQGDRDVRRSKAGFAHFTDGLVPPFRLVPTVVSIMDLTLVREWRAHRVVRYPRIPLVLAAPRLARRVICISQATADDVIRLTATPAKKIDVVHLAPRPTAAPAAPDVVDRIARQHGLAPGGYLMVPATIEPRKNHVRILQAFERLVKDGSIPTDMRLLFAGQVGWRAGPILEAIDASPVRSRIVMPGYLSDDDLIPLMTGAAAIVFVSTSEGFGLPILEGLACGTAVVTSNVSSMPEVAGDAAILADPFDVDAIGRGIVAALSADATSRERGIQHAARFTWNATATATAAVYERLR